MEATRLVELAVSVLLIVVVITVAFQLKNSGLSFARSFASDMNRTTTAIEESKFTKYETGLLSGADVVSAISALSGDIVVSVETCKDASTNITTEYSALGGSYLPSYTATPADAVSGLYINPNAKFKGTVNRTGAGAIIGLSFVQQEYVNSALAFENSNTPVVPGGTPGNTPSGGGNVVVDNSALTTPINTIQTNITAMSQDITALNNAVAQLASSFNAGISSGNSGGGTSGTISDANLETVVGRIDALGEQIAGLDSTVKALQNSSNSQNAGDTGNKDNDLSLQIGELGSKVDDSFANQATQIKELADSITSISTELGNLSAAIGATANLDGNSVAGTLVGPDGTGGIKGAIKTLQEKCDSMSTQLLEMQDVLNRTGTSAEDESLKASVHY